jgi:hypothetical protein
MASFCMDGAAAGVGLPAADRGVDVERLDL